MQAVAVKMRISRFITRVHSKFKIPSLKKFVPRLITRVIDLASILKCIPYKRLNPKDPTSIDLQINSRGLFLLVNTLLCAHAVAQWVSFFNYVPSQGLTVQACLQLNYLAAYTSLLIISQPLILHPHDLVNVQNKMEDLQKSFGRSWTTHPVLVLILAALQGFLVVSPFITLSFYLLDPTAPMFVVTRFINMELSGTPGGYGTIKLLIGALLESFVVLVSVLTVVCVVQAFAYFQFAMNLWMEELKDRTKGAKILKYSHLMLFDKLYRRIQVFSLLCNHFWGSIVVPGFAAVVVLGSSGSIFGIFRLYGHLPPLVYSLFPAIVVFQIGVCLLGVGGQVSKVNRNACDCLKEIVKNGRLLEASWCWNPADEDAKCVKKKLTAMRAFGVQIAIFGFFTAGTQIAMWDEIINYVLLLLSL